MESRTTKPFWRLFADLTLDVQRDANYDNVYSARIGLAYRALAVVKGDRVIWFWIGGHRDYDRLV